MIYRKAIWRVTMQARCYVKRSAILFGILGVCFVTTAYSSQGIVTDNKSAIEAAYNMEIITQTILAEASNEKITPSERHALLLKSLEIEFMPLVDHQFAAFKVLGSHIRNVPSDILIEYVDIFYEYMTLSYAEIFSQHTHSMLQFYDPHPKQSSNHLTLRATLKKQNELDVFLSLKLRQATQTGPWKNYDLIVQGNSIINNARNQYAPILRNQGIEAVMSKMQSYIAENS